MEAAGSNPANPTNQLTRSRCSNRTSLVTDSADLYTLTVEQTAGLDRMGEISAAALVAEIAKSAAQPLARVTTGLGARSTGRTLSRRMAARFRSLDALAMATVEELQEVKGIGARRPPPSSKARGDRGSRCRGVSTRAAARAAGS